MCHNQSVADAERGLAQIAQGTFQLLHTAIVYPEPFLLVTLIALGLPLWRGLRAAKPDVPSAPLRPDAAFVGLSMAVGLALIWALVPAIGATEFKVRYVYPALFVLPAFLLMLIARGRPAPLAVGAFAPWNDCPSAGSVTWPVSVAVRAGVAPVTSAVYGPAPAAAPTARV